MKRMIMAMFRELRTAITTADLAKGNVVLRSCHSL
jgi:hypothetical protein